MGFKLTVLLAMALFIAFYFVPEPEGGSKPPHVLKRAAELQEGAPPPVAPEPEIVVSRPDPDPDPDPQPVPAVTTEPQQTEAATGGLEGSQVNITPDELAADLAERLPSLGLNSLSSGDTAGALALSDSVRARKGETEAEDLSRPELASAGAVTDVAADQGNDVDQADALPRAQVLGTSVNLRSGPSVNSPVVGRVNFGDEVVLLSDDQNGWRSIAHPETGQEVFMASRFLQPLP